MSVQHRTERALMRILLAALILWLGSPVLAAGRDKDADSANAPLPQRIEVEKQSLVLNGQALRKIAFIKIYVAGLYLPDRETRPDAILASDEPRSLVMHFLRDVEAKRLCEGWDSSLAENTPNPSAELMEQFRILCSWMENAAEGERLTFAYVPGRGTTVEFGGNVKGPMAGKEFADALFRTWIGPKAIPGEEFKRHLLGAAR
jgi:hypothetical protein